MAGQIVIFALLDFIIGAAISALAPNFAVLLAGRMIQGIGTGLILPLMFTIVMQIFPPKKIGSIMGILCFGNHVCPGNWANFDWFDSGQAFLALDLLVI
jgi:predicted MFS family arabinose efflux permease